MAGSRPCTGPLRLGVASPDRLVPGGDRRVRRLGAAVPVLVPLEHLPWWSAPFFAERHGGTGPVRYVDWDALRRASDAELAASAAAPAGRDDGALWVSEVPEQLVPEADAAVGRFGGALGVDLEPVPLLGDEEAIEEQYLLHTWLATARRADLDLVGAWSGLVATGRATPDDPDGPSLFLTPSAGDVDAAWEIYVHSMVELSRTHPIRAELDRAAFERLVTSPRGGALVARAGGVPVSLALLGTDPAHFDWLDPRWIEAACGGRPPLVFPAIVTRPERRHQGSISGLLDLMVAVLLVGGAPVSVLFSCNNESRAYTPAIVQATVDRGAPEFGGTVELAARYVFRAWAVGRAGPDRRQA